MTRLALLFCISAAGGILPLPAVALAQEYSGGPRPAPEFREPPRFPERGGIGLPGASTVQLPTFGIAVDADGVLSVSAAPDPGGRLHARRVAEAKRALPADVFAPSPLRKISLVRLEKAVRAKLEAGDAPSEEMRHLAGLLWVQHVFCYPESGDVVIAGPAEGWAEDPSGRIVGATTRRPIVLLEDLIVALRQYPPGGRDRPFIGCTIDPDRDGLARLKEFQSRVPRVISDRERGAHAVWIAGGMRDALGMAEVRVFGVSPKTHFARVMIEADYRMKLIGIGLEPPPVKMVTFMDALKSASHSTLQRWWFTPNYDCVVVTGDRLGMELVGQGVQLLGEDKWIGADGALIDTGAAPSKASELFTLSFTRKYPEIAEASPVYAQLRNLIDLVVAAAFVRAEDYYGRADWTPGVFADERALPVETFDNPQRVMCAVNSQWKGRRLFTPAGGGVSIQTAEALSAERLYEDENGRVAEQRDVVGRETPADRWWWD